MPVRGLAEGTGPPQGRPEALLRTLHRGTLVVFVVIVPEQVEDAVDEEEGQLVFKAPARRVYAAGRGLQRDDDVSQRRALIQRKGQDVRGTVDTSPACVQRLNFTVVGEQEGQLERSASGLGLPAREKLE